MLNVEYTDKIIPTKLVLATSFSATSLAIMSTLRKIKSNRLNGNFRFEISGLQGGMEFPR